MHKLRALMAANRNKGFFRAEASDEKAIIYLYDSIAGSDDEAYWWGGVGPGEFARELAGISAAEIELRVNCPGGDVFGGRAIAAALKDHPARKVARVDGYAASAASYIIQACERVEMGEGSMIMIHKAWTIAWGNEEELLKTAALLRKIDGTIASTYAAAATRRGVDVADFASLMAAETWFTGPESVAVGLADAEVEPAQSTASNRVAWDLSAYDNAPKATMVTPPPPTSDERLALTVADQADSETDRPEIEHRRRLAQAIALQAA